MAPYTPHNYQRAGIQFGVRNSVAAFFLDPGLGKTSILYAIFLILRSKLLVTKMLVIAPLRVCHSVWPAEGKKWDDFRDLKVAVLHGPDKEARLRSDADVYVINPEGLDWYVRHVKDLPEMLVVDESTRFKHTTTQRFRTLKPLLPRFKRRYILTGSPAPNGLLDLYGQVFILDGGASLGAYFSHFRINYFRQGGYGGYTWTPKPGTDNALREVLKPLAVRMEAKDYLELPPLIENVVEIDLPDKAMRAYRQMENQLIVALGDDNMVIAQNASVAWSKCRQIANGGIFHEGGEEWSHIHEAKVDAVEEIVEELSGKPALVAYEYRHDLERLQKRFGSEVPYIGGGVPAKRFREIEQAWNRGELPLLLAQPQSVAHGLNLQGTGAAVIDHSLTPDLETDEQFVRRVWRQGQKDTVFRHRIVAKDTVDEALIGMLKRKDRTQRGLLSSLKDHLRKRAA